MQTRLFHTIVLCGALLSCGAEGGEGESGSEGLGEGGASAGGPNDPDPLERCVLPDGTCHEHCRYVGQGRCLDPCFAHGSTCSAQCELEDGTCGWHPTK